MLLEAVAWPQVMTRRRQARTMEVNDAHATDTDDVQQTRSTLPVGTHRLHEDVSMNFHLHRGIAWTGGDALPDIRGPSTSMLCAG